MSLYKLRMTRKRGTRHEHDKILEHHEPRATRVLLALVGALRATRNLPHVPPPLSPLSHRQVLRRRGPVWNIHRDRGRRVRTFIERPSRLRRSLERNQAMTDARQTIEFYYPASHLAAINAVIERRDGARKLVSICLRQYRAQGYHDVARQFLRHIKWVEYPMKG